MGFAASILACHAAEPLAGRWQGMVKIPGNDLTVVVDLAPNSGSSWIGSIIFPGLDVEGLPLKDLVVNGAQATFAMKTAAGGGGFEATFKGAVNANGALTGEFNQAGNTAPFELKQTGPPQVEVPPQSTPISKEIEGEWVGEFQLLGYARKVTLKLSNADHGAAAEFVVVGKRVNNLPVDLVTQAGSLLTIQSHETGITFEGRFHKGTAEIRGTFSQGAIEVPLILHRK